MREDIVSFYIDELEEYPFFIEMAGISYCDGTYKIERKNSNLYCFEYIIKGKGTVIINDEVYTPVEGDIYILQKGSNHKYYSDKENPWIKIWFNIKGNLIDQLMQVYKLNKIHHIPNLDLKELFLKFISTSKSTTDSTEEIFNKAAIIFHEIILNIHSRVKVLKVARDPLALTLKEYLDKHVEDNVSLQNLSDLIFKSVSQTIRLFKREFGITPYDYLLLNRIETAKLLLLNSNMQINEIAFKLNFSDEHYFSNYFKTKVGLSPLKFRRAFVDDAPYIL